MSRERPDSYLGGGSEYTYLNGSPKKAIRNEELTDTLSESLAAATQACQELADSSDESTGDEEEYEVVVSSSEEEEDSEIEESYEEEDGNDDSSFDIPDKLPSTAKPVASIFDKINNAKRAEKISDDDEEDSSDSDDDSCTGEAETSAPLEKWKQKEDIESEKDRESESYSYEEEVIEELTKADEVKEGPISETPTISPPSRKASVSPAKEPVVPSLVSPHPEPSFQAAVDMDEDGQKKYEWEKPSWAKSGPKLRATGKASKMKMEGNLAAPVTNIRNTIIGNESKNLHFEKPEWTKTAVAETNTTEPAPSDDTSSLAWTKPEWATKGPKLRTTKKGEALKSGKEIVRPIGGIKTIE